VNWLPEVLVKRHTQRGQWVEVTDTPHEDGRRVLGITGPIEFDVKRDAALIEDTAEAFLKVLGDEWLADKAQEVAAAKAAINAASTEVAA